MKKVGLALAVLMAITLVVGSIGCSGVKATGGGKIDDANTWWYTYDRQTGQWDYGYDTTKVTFGFNAKPVGEPTLIFSDSYYGDYYRQDAKGQMQVNLHDLGLKIHGTFTYMEYADPSSPYHNPEESADFRGTCTLKGIPGQFYAKYYDRGEPGASAGDYVQVYAWASDSTGYADIQFSGTIDGGNIQLHKK